MLLVIIVFFLTEKSDWVLHFFMPIGPSLARGMTICRILGHIIISVAFVLATTHYIKNARKSDLVKKKFAGIVVLMLWPAIMMILSFSTYSAWRNFYHYLDTTSAETESTLVAKMESLQPGQKKSVVSHLHAQHIYRYKGKITEYQSAEGFPVSYVPDEQDSEARRIITFHRAHNDSNRTVMIGTLILYGLSYLWVAYFGFIVPVRA